MPATDGDAVTVGGIVHPHPPSCHTRTSFSSTCCMVFLFCFCFSCFNLIGSLPCQLTPTASPLLPLPCCLSLSASPLLPLPCCLSPAASPLLPLPCCLSPAASPLLPLPCCLSLAASPLLPLPCCLSPAASPPLGLLGAWAYRLLDSSGSPLSGTDDMLNLLDGQADPQTACGHVHVSTSKAPLKCT